VLFAPQFFLFECRFRQDIGEDVHGERDVVLEDAGVIGCCLGGSGSIQFAADIFDFLGDVAGAPPLRAFEGHVLEKVSDTVLFGRFVTRSRFDPYTERDALQVGHCLGHDSQPGGKPGGFNVHI
jgi:hypothetical protein